MAGMDRQAQFFAVSDALFDFSQFAGSVFFIFSPGIWSGMDFDGLRSCFTGLFDLMQDRVDKKADGNAFLIESRNDAFGFSEFAGNGQSAFRCNLLAVFW